MTYNKAANYHQNRVFVTESGDVSYYSSLIAAAPEMLEVLENIYHNSDLKESLRSEIVKTIKKAKGE